MNVSWKLSDEEQKFFKLVSRELKNSGRPFVLWGWKRDKVVSGVKRPESRTVYFSGDFGLEKDELRLERAYFFLQTRASKDEILNLKEQIGENRKIGKFELSSYLWPDDKNIGYWWLKMVIGRPSDYDLKTVRRRLKGKPRIKIAGPRLIKPSREFDISEFAPLAVYCGSGLSSESGLPLLGLIHELFAVDDFKRGKLIFGADDPLPKRLVADVEREFAKFCEFSVDAIRAKPSRSHRILAGLYKKGIIKQVFTDNLDDILRKVGVAYIQARLSIFPDRYPVKFNPRLKAMLVVGIAVDRRDVIKQARRSGLKIIAINPVMGVAPNSRNMDYLYQGDILFKGRAEEVLPKIVKESGFGNDLRLRT